MRKLIAACIALLSLNILCAQDCIKIKTGKFLVAPDDYSDSETIVTRTDTYQFEEVKNKGVKLRFNVKWTSDCTYELSNGKVLAGDMPGLPANNILYVKVIKVNAKTYTAQITANFADLKLEKEIRILNN